MQYDAAKRYGDAGGEGMSYNDYQDALQEVHWDVAWQIFDEVNEQNDLDKQIDLACLDSQEAIAISKQKIFDVAKLAQKQFPKNVLKPQDYVFKIKTSENHMEKVPESNGSAPLKNVVLEMVKNEMQLDYYYIPQYKTILIRIDGETINNPVLQEW